MRVAVAVASLGRRQELEELLQCLARQTVAPVLTMLSVEQPSDAPEPRDGIEVVYGPRGSCAQRNLVFARTGDRADVILFFDDDYVPSRYAVEGAARLFQENPEVVGATGLVLADGIKSGGIEHDRANRLVAEYDAAGLRSVQSLKDIGWAYGCNMAFRVSATADVRFDERLPLYGWQEDVDFANQLTRHGRMVWTDAFAGVHCGVTRSRTPGRRLGYSQVVNPIYLLRKGTMPKRHAFRIMVKNLLANHLLALRPEPHVDRRGRLIGNWIGLGHLLLGRADPMYVLKL